MYDLNPGASLTKPAPIYRTKPCSWQGTCPATPDERLSAWAYHFISGGHHRLFQSRGAKPVSKRIYVVTDLNDPSEPVRLVNASNPAQALGYVSKNRFSARVATTRDVAVAVKAGIEVENDDTEETV